MATAQHRSVAPGRAPARLDARRVGESLLADLGAEPGPAGPRARGTGLLRGERLPWSDPLGAVELVGESCDDPGLPAGVVEVASGYAAAAAALLAGAGGTRTVSRAGAAATVLMPLLLGGVEEDGRSGQRRVGDGAVVADLGAEDERLFKQLLRSLPGPERGDPERLAAAAQAWRLPVLAFSQRPERIPGGPVARTLEELPGSPAGPPAGIGSQERPLAGVRVCDMGAMWAAPLATSLLAGLGADVVKVEPAARPDGLRARGAGIDPLTDPGPMFRQLNGGSRRADLDLRRGEDRGAFAELVASSDLLVESFSPRVLSNLGYDRSTLRALNPDLLLASVRAFPPGPRRSWVAYGSGIHAASGLGDLGAGRFAPAVVSYPDPLAGLALVAAILAQLAARQRHRVVSSVEVSLWDAVAPLHRFRQPGRLAEPAGPATASPPGEAPFRGAGVAAALFGSPLGGHQGRGPRAERSFAIGS